MSNFHGCYVLFTAEDKPVLSLVYLLYLLEDMCWGNQE